MSLPGFTAEASFGERQGIYLATNVTVSGDPIEEGCSQES
jgi:hypothetical protein